VAVWTPVLTLIGHPIDANVFSVSEGEEKPEATVFGLPRSGAPFMFGQKNVTLIVSASQARVPPPGLLLTFDTVIVYVSVEPFTTKPVGSWTTMTFRAVSLQKGGDCEFGLRERTWVTRRAMSSWPVAEAARRCALWARAWSERSTRKRIMPRRTVASPADFRKDEERDAPVPGVDLTKPPDTRRARHPNAPAWPDPTCTQKLASRRQSGLMHLCYGSCV
jgi:hypothetical protein